MYKITEQNFSGLHMLTRTFKGWMYQGEISIAKKLLY